MKSRSEVGVLLLALTLLLSLYHPTHSFTYNPTADDAGTAVLDADGDPLKPNTLYNITTDYGEVILGHEYPPLNCPYEVLVTSNPPDNGKSVKFFPEDATATATSILESTRLAIRFSSSTLPPECADRTHWDISGGYVPSFVMTHPSFSYNFMFKKAPDTTTVEDRRYRIGYCPSVSGMCYTIGTICTQSGCPRGIAHLAISYSPITVQFLKTN
ncbi:PREDICTED: sporamin B-like [Ipomoea nil]|uniref:sporamin B-like n=1 Tax=Ipomoea nil TaxID=35883 RepID=UPI0009019EE6|nr:PREDICTED: sporamin B-like [Ipomoea nil]